MRITKPFVFIAFLFISMNGFSQVLKPLYFLADTTQLKSSNINKTLEIKWTTPFHYSFIFYSPKKAPYYNSIEFASRIDKKNPKPVIETIKPKRTYIGLNELLKLGAESPRYFSEIYDLYIVEALPDKKFRTYKVEIVPQTAPTSDAATLKN